MHGTKAGSWSIALLVPAAVSFFTACTSDKTIRSVLFNAKAAQLVASEKNYSFGERAVHSYRSHIFIIENQGDLIAHIRTPPGIFGPFSFKGGQYPGIGGTCGDVIGKGQSCRIVATFHPVSFAPYGEDMTIPYNDGGLQTQTLAIHLLGQGSNIP